MRILSLNAWGGALFEDLRAWLPSCGADVICLQEVTRTPGLGGWTTFADGERTLPQRADLFGDLLRLLPGHQSCARRWPARVTSPWRVATSTCCRTASRSRSWRPSG